MDESEFPEMSDLQVAALAAAGKSIADLGADGSDAEDESNSSSGEEESSSSEEEESSSSEEESEEASRDATDASKEADAPAATAAEAAERGDAGDPTASEGVVGVFPETKLDSDDDSSDWRSESSEDVNFPGTEAIKKIINKTDANDSDDEAITSKNEAKDLPPLEPITVDILPEDKVEPCGYVTAVLDGQVVIQAPPNSSVLAEGSIVVQKDRSPIGRVEEVFGPVQAPLYLVRYAGPAGEATGPESGLAAGTELYAVTKHSDYVATDKLYIKGYDNSGKDDEEAVLEADFSDDEKEAEYKQQQKVKKRKGGNNPQLPADMAVAQQASQQGAQGDMGLPRGGGARRGRGNPQHTGQRPTHGPPGVQQGGHEQPRHGGQQGPMPMFPPSPYGPGQGLAQQGMFMPMPMGGFPMQQPMYNMGPGQAYGYFPQNHMMGGPQQGFMPPGGPMGPMPPGMMPAFQQQQQQQQQGYYQHQQNHQGQNQQQQQPQHQLQYGYGNQEQQGLPPPY